MSAHLPPIRNRPEGEQQRWLGAGASSQLLHSCRELAQDGAAQHYRQGTPDGSRPGIYYAHLSDMTTMPVPEIETIAYHEGNPGHHMQISIAQELEDTPKFRANGEYIPAFAEGWGLYSEWLAKEMGGFEDPYQDFGRLH